MLALPLEACCVCTAVRSVFVNFAITFIVVVFVGRRFFMAETFSAFMNINILCIIQTFVAAFLICFHFLCDFFCFLFQFICRFWFTNFRIFAFMIFAFVINFANYCFAL